jgi:hypothetical protein
LFFIVYDHFIERCFTTTTTKPTTRPLGYWKNKENQKKFFDELAIKWNIQKTDDWNKVTKEMATKEGGHFIGNYYNGSVQQGTMS